MKPFTARAVAGHPVHGDAICIGAHGKVFMIKKLGSTRKSNFTEINQSTVNEVVPSRKHKVLA